MEKKNLRPDTINEQVVVARYAVRGQIVQRAQELDAQLKSGATLPFSEVVYCNIGNPQLLGQKPITFFRQVLALCECPSFMDNAALVASLPSDVVARAKAYLSATGGVGAYSNSAGVDLVRQEVAAFIACRDGFKVRRARDLLCQV